MAPFFVRAAARQMVFDYCTSVLDKFRPMHSVLLSEHMAGTYGRDRCRSTVASRPVGAVSREPVLIVDVVHPCVTQS